MACCGVTTTSDRHRRLVARGKRAPKPTTKRVYLSGPEVLPANARQICARKRAICERHGVVGVLPGNEEDGRDPALPLSDCL
jgi:hypothetical protein